MERFALVTIFLAMVALYFFNVLMREFGGTLASDFSWIQEAVGTLNVYLVFLASGLALERGRQVGIHTWRDRIGTRTRLPIRKIIDAVSLVFSLYIAWLAWGMTQFVMMTGERTPNLDIPVTWTYVAPIIGFLLLALRYLLSLFGVIDRFTPQTSEDL